MTGPAPVPGGPVSTVRGRLQAPALRALTVLLVLLSALAVLLPGSAGHRTGVAVVALCVAAPLLRVAWLVRRFVQERDGRFAVRGLLLLVLVAAGPVLASRG